VPPAIAGGGRPLATSARVAVESSFGHDFSDVRVHDGAESDALTRAYGARAFTTGNDIFFREGAYAPDDAAGQQLIAHEATHVVQHAHAGAGGARPRLVSRASDPVEVEAETAAQAVTSGSTPSVSAAPSATVARDEEDSGWGDLLTAGLTLAGDVIPGAGFLTEPALATMGVQEGAEGHGTGWAHTATGIMGLASEFGGFELAEAAGMSVLGTGEGTLAAAAGAGELGTMGLMGPLAAVAGAGLGGAAFGNFLSKHTEVGENTVDAIGGFDSFLGDLGLGDPEHGKGALLSLDEYREEQWDKGGIGGWAKGGLAALGEGAVGLGGAAYGLGEGAAHGLEYLGEGALSGLESAGEWIGDLF
jgi:hypothetical protein